MEQTEKTEKTVEGLVRCSTGGCAREACPYHHNLPEDWRALDCNTELARDALALIRQQQERIKELEAGQTARVMTLEEAIEAVSKKGGFVWMEQKSHPLCDAHVSPSNSIFDCPSRKFKDYGKRFIPKKNSFRFMWRCWTSWPTDEQMKEAAPW